MLTQDIAERKFVNLLKLYVQKQKKRLSLKRSCRRSTLEQKCTEVPISYEYNLFRTRARRRTVVHLY